MLPFPKCVIWVVGNGKVNLDSETTIDTIMPCGITFSCNISVSFQSDYLEECIRFRKGGGGDSHSWAGQDEGQG